MVVRNVRENEGRALLEMLDAIRLASQGSTAISVRILAAADHDGVCATRILVTVLQRAGVKYTVVPVTGNKEIIEHIGTLGEDVDLRSLVLLNCGASLDMQRNLDESEAPPELHCYVVDAHRPMHLANLSERSPRVVVLDDDPIAEVSEKPPVDDDDEEDDASEAVSDAEQENFWDPDAPGGAASAAEIRSRKRLRMAERVERMAIKKQRINEYYMSAYYATPAAMSIFKLSKLHAPASEELLWVAAVSLTGYYDLDLLPKLSYERMAWEELKETLDRTGDFTSQSSGAARGDEVGTAPEAADGGFDDLAPRRASGAPPERRRLRFEQDLRLTLYKHWTLEESIMHSSYFYGVMELHRDKGQRALKHFFATAGITPSDYRQLYTFVMLPVRKALHDKFTSKGRGYGLTADRMFLHQFVRELGLQEEGNALFLHDLSCLDAVHIVTALLSAVPPSLSGSRLEHLPQTEEGNLDSTAVNELERQAMVSNFWRAFDAVGCREPGPLHQGISEAMEMAKAVQSLSRLLKDSKALHGYMKLFRWCRIEQPPHTFRHHIAVRRLAVWLLHVFFMYRPKLKEDQDLPLLMIVRDKVRGTYLCVGATPPSLAEQDEFGNRFRSVLRTDPSLRYRYDFFDKACIEVAADDFDRFFDLLSRA